MQRDVACQRWSTRFGRRICTVNRFPPELLGAILGPVPPVSACGKLIFLHTSEVILDSHRMDRVVLDIFERQVGQMGDRNVVTQQRLVNARHYGMQSRGVQICS